MTDAEVRLLSQGWVPPPERLGDLVREMARAYVEAQAQIERMGRDLEEYRRTVIECKRGQAPVAR